PKIKHALCNRRAWLDLKESVRRKGSLPAWDSKFEDADGNILTFKEIVQGLIDNFHGKNTTLRWCLNEHVPIPSESHPLKNPGLEITGPWHPLSRAFNQLNADVAVAFEDEEDASPAWYVPYGSNEKYPSVWEARRNVKRVIEGSIPEIYYEKGKEYRLLKPRNKWPAIFHRLPSIHLLDETVKVNGKPVPAIITSLVIYVLNNYDNLAKLGKGVNFYLPKIQFPQEALIVEKMFRRIEGKIGVKKGTLKVAILYEEGIAGLYFPVILWILRERLIKSSNGRWDYLASLIEMWKDEAVFPDPQNITMTSPNMMAYQRYNALMLLMAGMKNGEPDAAPVGGMAAVMLYPKTDPYARYRFNQKALRDIKLDKLRERLIGLIFVSEEKIDAPVTLEDILQGKFKGKLYDMFRQSWVATKEESYVEAGNEPLRAKLEDLQAIIDRRVEYVEVGGNKFPTVASGLTPEEKARFINLGLLNKEGKITPWVIHRYSITEPEQLYSKELWNGKDLWEALYSVPYGDITIEHIQHAFYMIANYGFQILNGNLAAAIDDYELNQRFMNDLATYRIFVTWLWTLLKHKARITRNGYLKGPQRTENGVILAKNLIEISKGTIFDEELFKKVWEQHYEWTKMFYEDYDRIVAKRLIEYFKLNLSNESLMDEILASISKAYAAGPFLNYSSEAAAKDISELLGVEQKNVEEIIIQNAPRFDRSKADVIMDVLYKLLLSKSYLQHNSRFLFAIASTEPTKQRLLLDVILNYSREEVLKKVERGELETEILQIYDYVYDYKD
ncbi:MAG TPA: malate synthase, partial [Geobacterales bacterium]|nr:malate synthase [Geobacterales bacterium]